MNSYKYCYVEKYNGLWWISYPDGSKAWPDGFKTQREAMETLDWMCE